ncbi:hypothetical protein GCM10027082_24760 [Comamonas humi]
MKPIVAALLMSLAANGLLGWAYLEQRDKTAAAATSLRDMQAQRDGARADASACSDAVDDLRDLAQKRAKEGEKARHAAAATARPLERRADYTLGLQPKDPFNQCASMQALGDEWLQGRAKP